MIHHWAVLIVMSSHEPWMIIFPILNDEQMSNKVSVEHQPDQDVEKFNFCKLTQNSKLT